MATQVRIFGRHVLRVAPLFLLIPLLLNIRLANAETIDGVVLDIDSSTPAGIYDVRNGGTLNSTGANTFDLRADNDSTLNLNGGSVTDNRALGGGAITLAGSTLNMTGTQVTSATRFGLAVGADNINGLGSLARVTDSVINGAAAGAQVSGASTLELANSALTATRADGIGLISVSGIVRAQGGSITGGGEGISIRQDDLDTTRVGTLVLNGTQVTGQAGSAIELIDGASANIDILNGTTLTGGNGTIFDVLEGSTATVKVGQSNLSGNINVDATSTGTFDFDRGSLTGDLIVAEGGTANVGLANGSQFTGRMQNVQAATLDGTSQWMMTGDSSVGSLTLNGGRVTMGDTDAFYTLNLESLSGNGTFVMGSNFASNATDFLNVNGTATGSHELLISASGTDPAAGNPLHVVHTGGGDAAFNLVGGQVDLGTYSYKLKQEGTDWYLDPESREISPGTKTIMALYGVAPTVFYGELTTLRTRMGELRYSEGRSSGLWVRAHGSQHNVADASSGVGYTQNQQGMSFGADAPLPYGDGQWLIGALAGYSKSDLNLAHGTSGTIDSYYLGGYATWLDAATGYYVDTVIKYNRYQNHAKVGLSDGERTKGDYDNHGIGGSVEVGRHIKLNDGFFVEPYAQIAGTVIQSKDYEFDNGMEADGDATRSLLGKVGATVGKTYDLGQGRIVQPYLKAAVAHEFVKNNEVQVNDNSFNNDLSGSRGELGAGVALSLSKDFQVHADFEYSNGKNIEMPYSMNLGLRYFW